MEINFTGFKSLNTSTKTFILSMLALTPFWYMSIFLFKKDLITNNEWHIAFIFSICLSLLWFFSNLLVSIVATFKLKDRDTDMMLFVGGSLSILYISFLELVLYLIDRHTDFKITYTIFILASFLYVVFRLIWMLLFSKKLGEAIRELEGKMNENK